MSIIAGDRKTTAPIGVERVKPLDKPKPIKQDLTLHAKAMRISPRKSIDLNRSTISNRQNSPTLHTEGYWMQGAINYGRLIQSQHVAERPKLVQFKMNLNKMHNQPSKNMDINSQEEIGRNTHMLALSQNSKDESQKNRITMPKIVTANQTNDKQKTIQDGNRAQVKIGALGGLNPGMTSPNNDLQGANQAKNSTDHSVSQLGAAPVQTKPALGKPMNILAQMIGKALVKDVVKERDRIIKETKELCDKDFSPKDFDGVNYVKGLHMSKAMDRMKHLKKKGMPEITAEYFKSIEERMNPKDAKIPSTTKKSKKKSPDKEASDIRTTEKEIFSDGASRRSSTAGYNNVQNFKGPAGRRRRLQGSQTKNNEDIQHVKDQRETVYQNILDRHNITNEKIYHRKSPHQSMNIEWQPIKRHSNLSLSIDQKMMPNTTASKFQRRTAARWLDQSLHDTSIHDDEQFNMVRGGKYQNLSQSIGLQTYKKFKSRMGALNQMKQKDETLENLVNIQSPKAMGQNKREPLNLSKYYTKFGPTVVQRINPDFNIHGPNTTATGNELDSALFQSQQKSKFKENCTDIETMLTERGTIIAIQGFSPDHSLQMPSDRNVFDKKQNQIALQDQSAFLNGSDLESIEQQKAQQDLGVILNQSIDNSTQQSKFKTTEDPTVIGYATQPIVNEEIDTLLDSARLAEISKRDHKLQQPRNSNQFNNSINFSDLRQVMQTQRHNKLQMPNPKRARNHQKRISDGFKELPVQDSHFDEVWSPNQSQHQPFYLVEFRRLEEQIDLFEIQDMKKDMADPLTQASLQRPKSAGRPDSKLLQAHDSITSKQQIKQKESQLLAKIERQSKNQKIYVNALEHIIEIVVKKMQQKSLGNLLQRLSLGINDTQGRLMSNIESYIHESEELKEKQNVEFKQLLDKFDQFKQKNNLDEYFEKYLNNSTRKQTVEQVQDLLNKEDDWIDKMQDYFNSLQKYQSSDSTIKLESLSQEMSSFRQRLQIFEEQNKLVEDAIQDAMKKEPMAPNVFGKEMNKVIDDQYNYGVYETGKKVAERLIAYYVKPKADASCNTESMKELQMQLEEKVAQQQEQIEIMQEEYQLMVHREKGLKQKIIDTQNAKLSMQQDYEKMYEQNEQFMRDKKALETIQSKLYQQLQNCQDGLREEQLSHTACRDKLQAALNKVTELNEKLTNLMSIESQFDDLTFKYQNLLGNKAQLVTKLGVLKKFHDQYKVAVKTMNIKPAAIDTSKRDNADDLSVFEESDEIESSQNSPDNQSYQYKNRRESVQKSTDQTAIGAKQFSQESNSMVDKGSPNLKMRASQIQSGENRKSVVGIDLNTSLEYKKSEINNSIGAENSNDMTPHVDHIKNQDSYQSDQFRETLQQTAADIDKQLEKVDIAAKQSESYIVEAPLISNKSQNNVSKDNFKKDNSIKDEHKTPQGANITPFNQEDSKADTINRDQSLLGDGSQINQQSTAENENFVKPSMVVDQNEDQDQLIKISTQVKSSSNPERQAPETRLTQNGRQ